MFPLRFVRCCAPSALALFAALLLMAGCARQAVIPARTAAPAPGGARVLLTLSPAAPRALDPTTFIVHAVGSDKRPVVDARMTADLTMPGMQMPPSRVSLTPAAPGTYTGQGRFSMPGQWAVTVSGADKGRRTQAVFPITVR